MSRYFCAILCFAMAIFANAQNADLVFKYVDPLEKVFPESNYFVPADAHADVARGEHASFQFVVRCNSSISDLAISVEPPKKGAISLTDIRKGFVGFVRDTRTSTEPARDFLRPVSGFYPDPITFEESKNVDLGVTQPLWLTIAIPKDVEPGVYTGKVQISGTANGKPISDEETITIEVFKPVIDKTSLWITNWFYLDKLYRLNNDKPVDKHSDLYWELVRVLAKNMAEYRQNMAKVSPYDHTDFKLKGKKWSFDFTNYNKMVRLFEEEGVIGKLEGGHLGKRMVPGWSNPYGLFVPQWKNDSIYNEVLPIDNPRTKSFYEQFLPAFFDNLKKNGWAKEYVQHIADEPNEGNMESYKQVTAFVKSLVPGLKVIEATHEYRLEDEIDVWVPHMATLQHRLDFYKERQEKGDEVWYYTCHSPKGEFANRFVGLPLIKTRLLHWVNYKYEIPGYLHWGYNFWGNGDNLITSDNPFYDTSSISFRSGMILSGGDCWIIYPGDKTIYPSIRLEAMRDGIVDYELLKMYEERFPEKARNMANTVVYDFNQFDTNIELFRKKRRQLLEDLSN